MLFVLSLIFALAGVAGAAEDSPDYGVRPAQLGGADRPGAYFAHAVEPETAVVDAVEVFNLSGEPAFFDIYAADLVPSTGGGLMAASREADVIGAGTWLIIEEEVLEVPPRSSALVDFTIEVPVGTVPDDYFAAVMVESRQVVGTGTIVAKTRVGLRVEIEVLGEINLAVALGTLTAAPENGGFRFEVSVTNNGDVTFGTDGSVTVTNRSGDVITDLPMGPSGLFVAPGEQVSLYAVWENPPLLGRYEAQAGIDALVGDRAPRQFQSEPLVIWLIPWAEIAVVLSIVGLLAWLFVSTRSRLELRGRHRREEKALIRDFRERRHLEESRTS